MNRRQKIIFAAKVSLYLVFALVVLAAYALAAITIWRFACMHLPFLERVCAVFVFMFICLIMVSEIGSRRIMYYDLY